MIIAVCCGALLLLCFQYNESLKGRRQHSLPGDTFLFSGHLSEIAMSLGTGLSESPMDSCLSVHVVNVMRLGDRLERHLLIGETHDQV